MKKIDNEETMEAMQHQLEFLTIFIGFAASRGVGQDQIQDLLVHTEAVAIKAAYLSYMCWVNTVGRGRNLSKIEPQYSKMLQIPPDVRDTHVRVLEASRSSHSTDYNRMDDNIVVYFIDSLLDNHWELPASASSLKVSTMKILIEVLWFWINFITTYKKEKFGELHEEMIDFIGA